ncbi:MAG TPA: ABC transporter permease subunit [Verrucomicrobiae bacterium]|jgi:ABC-type transport system involved in cytochrome c biogenesis permease component
MTFLPVVERELRVAARRRSAYWGRFAAGLAGSVLFALIWKAADESEQDRGADALQAISAVIFVYAGLAGLLVTCDCLSEEKREGTLGLLFLTDLKGHDVVLGKLAATSVNILYGMLAVMPMLAIPFLVGGVAWPEMLRIALVSLNLLFCFLSIGLFVSALCRRDSLALTLSILVGLTVAMGGPSLSQIQRFPFRELAALSSPAAGCMLAFRTAYAKEPAAFWANTAATQLYGWIFLSLSCWLTRRAWQDEALGIRRPRREAAPSSARAQRRRENLDANPFLWRAARSGPRPAMVWMAMIGVTIVLLALMHWSGIPYWAPGSDLILLAAAGFVLKAWLAVEASRALSEDRRDGGLELLLTTPLHERDIVRGQAGALARQFGPPAAGLALANLAFLAANERRWPLEGRMELVWMHLIAAFFLAADMRALSWTGMWLGLVNRKANRAALLALARIVFLPVALYAFALYVLSFLLKKYADIEMYFYVLWCLPGLAADMYFGFTARRKLLSQFRSIVSEGAARKTPAKPSAAAATLMAEAA